MYSLERDNELLRQEVEHLKIKDRAKDAEINSLRKTVSELHKSIDTLMKARGPSALEEFPSLPKKSRGSEEEKRRRESTASNFSHKSEHAMEVDIALPGCLKDMSYMRQEEEWPRGKGSTSWTQTASKTTKNDYIANRKSK